MNKYGFVRVASGVPLVKVGAPAYNAEEMLKVIKEAEKQGIDILTFPELSLTSYSCGDLFHQSQLYTKAENALQTLLMETKTMNILFTAGLPIKKGNQQFNCVALIQKGEILGVVPKTHLPNYSEFYEKRWFSSGDDARFDVVTLCGQEVPFGSNLLFQSQNQPLLTIAVEICEDLWTVVPPSSFHALMGATVILNPSASNELVGKHSYRKTLVESQSASCIAGYVYTSAGIGESTTDVVFGGSAMIAENGTFLAEAKRFSLQPELICADIDLERLTNLRTKNTGFMQNFQHMQPQKNYRTIWFTNDIEQEELIRPISRLPFVPKSSTEMKERCEEILDIQAAGLMKRLMHLRMPKVVLGISGGLDSTLALLVIVRAFERLGLSRSNILGVTMPGFGTTDRTYQNAIQLMRELKIQVREISIVPSVTQHFKDLKIDSSVHDVTYENAQARERTQILMDLANKENGIVIGTGDLSELALGWATYNGDHMSMYGVNASIPKTLVKHLVAWAAGEMKEKKAAEILMNIVSTPVSPELLPPSADGKIQQMTEEVIGKYDLNDFFLYHVLKNGFSPQKIYYLAKIAFRSSYTDSYILEHLKKFYHRFFTQQFKRSCSPDGVKVGTVSLSPRGDWRMPSDASAEAWLEDLKEMEVEQ